MRVLNGPQKLLSWTGLQFHDDEPIWYKVYRVFCFWSLCSLIQPQTAYMFENLHDIIKVTDVFVQISAEIMSSMKVIVFMVNRKLSTQLLREIQADFDRSEVQGEERHFTDANNETNFVTRINNKLLIIAGVVYSGGPLFIIVYNYLRGTLRPEMWVHPFKGDFIFNSHTSPGYEIGYLLNIIYNVYVGSFFGAIDTLYVGLCLYSGSYMDYLKDSLSEMNSKFKRKTINKESAESYRIEMKTIVLRHYKALDFIENLKTFWTGIIFIQFGGVICILSTITFQIIISNDGRVLFYLAPCIAVVVELFLFCYYGSKMTTKSFEVLSCIYDSDWYEYPIECQKYVGLMMARLQQPIILTGYGVVRCNLPTFIAVLRFVGSVITVFQSIQ